LKLKKVSKAYGSAKLDVDGVKKITANKNSNQKPLSSEKKQKMQKVTTVVS
jgi:hypothetical protein